MLDINNAICYNVKRKKQAQLKRLCDLAKL